MNGYNLGENGEALLNPLFFEILKYLRRKRPNNPIMLISNIDRLDKKTSKRILELDLTELHCNIDGATKETYQAVKKGLSFEKVKSNLHAFLNARNEMGSACRVRIDSISAHRYFKFIDGFETSLPDDSEAVRKYWSPYLQNDDKICIPKVIRWAVRHIERKPRTRACALLPRTENECFIAANGNMYLCCYDYSALLAYGNIRTTSIKKAWTGSRRKEFMDMLRSRKFQELGEPCQFCQD